MRKNIILSEWNFPDFEFFVKIKIEDEILFEAYYSHDYYLLLLRLIGE